MDSSLRRLVLFLVAALAVILPGALFAQAGALPVPISIGAHSAIPTGLQSTVTFDARGVPGAANAGYYSRPVLISNNTLGGLANNMIRRAVPVAGMMAAIAAAGWAIDELTKQVMNGPPSEVGAPPGTSYWQMSGNYFPSAESAGQWYTSHLIANGFAGAQPVFQGITNCTAPSPSGTYVCDAAIKFLTYGDTNYYGVNFVPNNNPGVFTAYSFVPQPQPVPLADLGALVKQNPGLWNDALRNPDGSVNRNPDVQAAAQALANELANQTPQPDPTEGWDDGSQGGPSPGTATELEFPGFCSWASVVCDAIEWVRAPADGLDEIGMPFEEIPVSQSTWVSGLGNGSCPAPRSIGLSVGSFDMSYQPACDLAGYVRPLVIISALLLGAFIVVGAGRQA